MALAIGTQTNSNLNPGGPTQTLAHSHDVGSDGFLLVVISMASTTDFSECAYNGTPMTLISNTLLSGYSSRQAAYGLVNPDTGSNNIVVTFTGNQWSSTSISAVSFTGSSGAGNTSVVHSATTPNEQFLDISANSVIYAAGISDNAQSFGYEIAGSTRANLFYHNINKTSEAALSETGLAAGSTSIITKADFGTVSNNVFEIKEAGGVTPTSRRIFLIT